MRLLAMRRLRRLCEQQLADLPIPEPFSIPELVSNMERMRGRRIILVPMGDQGADLRTACGLRVRTATCSFILYRQRPTKNQMDHTALHELAHEWMDHGTDLSDEDFARFVPPYVHTRLIRRMGPGAIVQARARYGTLEEQLAELSASVIKRRVRLAQSDQVGLLEESLSHQVRHSPRHKQ
ncbi:hypothetical protein ACH4TQ_14665 [Streptomyces sp. NPDC021218]|nr:hypothetical protein [Streptomyces antimycoticus]